VANLCIKKRDFLGEITVLEALWLVFKRHWGVGLSVFAMAMVSVLGVGLLTPKVYEVTASFYVQREVPTEYHSDYNSDLLDHLRILKSDLVLMPVIQQINQRYPKHTPLDLGTLSKRLRADNGLSAAQLFPSTKVVDISFQDEDRHFAADVLTSVLKGYEKALAFIAEETRLKGVGFLQHRLEQVQVQRQQVQKALQTIHIQTGSTDIDLKNSEIVKTGTHYAQLLGGINAELAANREKIQNIKAILGLSSSQVKVLATIKQDPILQALQKQEANAKGELTQLLGSYTEYHPSVKQKQAAIQEAQRQISQRIRQVYGFSFSGNIATHGLSDSEKVTVGKTSGMLQSDLDQSLGEQLIELTVERSALGQQQQVFQQRLAHVAGNATDLASQQSEKASLQFRLESLESEARKLQDKIQDIQLEQANLLNLGSFVIISPPSLPEVDDYVFPMSEKLTLAVALTVAMALSVFSIALAEWLNPQVLLGKPPGLLLGEIYTSDELNKQLASVYATVALLMKQSDLKIITILDILSSEKQTLHNQADRSHRTPSIKQGFLNPYPHRYSSHPSSSKNKLATAPGKALLRQSAAILGSLFANRQLKTLLIENAPNATLPATGKELVEQTDAYSLYHIKSPTHLYRLVPMALPGDTGGTTPGYDPLLLTQLSERFGFDLVLIHQTVQEHHVKAPALLQAGSDATILGVSKRFSSPKSLLPFQRAAEHGQLRLLGSILFP
jgi:uncharacterized protein involved in exopolysaccharide biosynthesis